MWRLCLYGLHARACVLRSLSKNGFTGPILESIVALTRMVTLYAPRCSRPSRGVRKVRVAAQVPRSQPVLGQRAADDLGAEGGHAPVRLPSHTCRSL